MTQASSSGRVWVVDDNQLHAEACREALGSSFHVDVFHDGAVVLEKMVAGGTPDALVVDWYMPDVSGIDLVRALRDTYTATELPVIVVTAERSRAEAARAIDAGANDYIDKPFSPEELRGRVNALVRGKRQFAELRDAQRRLQEDALFRERLLGVLAHDLQQPLHLLTLGIELMTKPLSRDDQARAGARLHSVASRMTRMIQQLLDFTRPRVDGRFPIQRGPVRLDHLVRSIVDEVAETTTEHVLDLEVDGDCAGAWDEDRVGQVIANLLTNALAHGERPSVIQIRVEGRAEDVAMSVTNRGEPLEPSRRDSLFEPFRKGPSSGGLGLGLYIVKEIVDAHRGTVHVRSDDRMTTFEVVLPRS